MPRLATFGKRNRRKGSVLVEYALLIAGVVLASVVAITVLGRKTADVIGVMAATLPGAHATDNQPIASADIISLDTSGGVIRLNSLQLVSGGGLDRFVAMLGPGGGALLVQQ